MAGKLTAALASLRDAVRSDGWQNPLSGLGTWGRDRAKRLEFVPEASLALQELSWLFREDDMCRKIVSIFPQEALRLGFDLAGPDAEAAKLRCEALALRKVVLEAAVWGRLYGGAVIVLTTDSPAPEMPLEASPTIRCLDVYDRRSVERPTPTEIESDPREASYGQRRLWRISTDSGKVVTIHRSRCIVFGGAMTGRWEKRANAGWDDSVLEVVIATVRAFNSGFLSLDNMLTDASTGVLKMAGVISNLGSDAGKETLQTRAALFDMMRNVTRSLFLDAEENESYEKIATNFTGVPEVIDRLGQRVSAATEIPLTKLIGVTSNGIGATGEGDRLNWIDTVTAYRSHELEPQLRRLVGYIAPGHTISWPPLWTPTATEAAALKKARADTAGVYVQNDILRPEALTDSAAADLGLPAQLPPEPVEPEPIDEVSPAV